MINGGVWRDRICWKWNPKGLCSQNPPSRYVSSWAFIACMFDFPASTSKCDAPHSLINSARYKTTCYEPMRQRRCAHAGCRCCRIVSFQLGLVTPDWRSSYAPTMNYRSIWSHPSVLANLFHISSSSSKGLFQDCTVLLYVPSVCLYLCSFSSQ